MKTSQSAARTLPYSTGQQIGNKLNEIYQSVKESRPVKVVGFLATVAAGLVILGAMFRILSWTAIGWNQFAKALKIK